MGEVFNFWSKVIIGKLFRGNVMMIRMEILPRGEKHNRLIWR
jgi:hypothetical protein